jgi:hypothetical protein
MKRFYLIITLILLLGVSGSGQSYILFDLRITFEDSAQYAVIDQSMPGNIWQKGTPHKTFFDSAYSVPYAIVTDTSGPYPANNLSSFKVKMEYIGSCWGIGFLEFWHRYDMDPGHAGGYIDVSYDTSGSFQNVIFDTVPMVGIGSNNFYTQEDTITGGIPAFTGNSGEWVYSSIMWVWFMGVKDPFMHDSLTIRFNLKSDGTAIPKEGWMVDDIYLELDECTGAMQEYDRPPRVSIYPNPSDGEASFALINFPPGKYLLNLYDTHGIPVIPTQNISPPMYHFHSPGLGSGVYFYKISDKDGKSVSGKLIIGNQPR